MPGDHRLAVAIQGVRKVFDGRAVLEQFELDIRTGEFVALLGASGSGKTTLLRILAGLERPDGGRVLVPERRTVVFQEPRLVASMRVLGNVMLGQRSGPQARSAAEAALRVVGLEDHLRSWPGTLSGGEAQRVSLARALVREPELLLLDEPFAALDALTRLNMQQLVVDLCRRHEPSVLLVTHDVDEAILLADRIVVLTDGRVSFDQRLEIPASERRSGFTHDELRRRLLAELGVVFEAGEQSGVPASPREPAFAGSAH